MNLSIVYNGLHSITFYTAGEPISSGTPTSYSIKWGSWSHFHLVPLKRPSVAISSPSIEIIEIPGNGGSKRIDLTDLLPGGLKFGTRKGRWTFIVDIDKYGGSSTNWDFAKLLLETFFNGRTMYCVLEDDHDIAYRGTFIARDWNTSKEYTTVAIEYELEYKMYTNAFNSYY